MINLEWFRTFKVVYEIGTLSAAARSLFISQPGVSLHLNSLESYTGYRLFERESRRVVPTDRGIMLYNYIKDALVCLEEIEKNIHKKSRTARPTISLGMCYTIFQHVLEEQVSQVPFNLLTRFSENCHLLDDLNNGAIDFSITTQTTTQPSLVFTPFSKERLILICGSKTDTTLLDQLIAADNKKAIKSWLKKQKWFATAANMQYLKCFWLTNFKESPDFCADYIFPYFGSILRCLKSNTGFTVIPDILCRQHILQGGIKLVWEGNPHHENVLYFGKKKNAVYPDAIQFIENLLTQYWSQVDDMPKDQCPELVVTK